MGDFGRNQGRYARAGEVVVTSGVGALVCVCTGPHRRAHLWTSTTATSLVTPPLPCQVQTLVQHGCIAALGDAVARAKPIAEVALDGLENILKLVQMSSEAEASLRSKLQAVKTHGDEGLTRKALVEVSG